MIKVEGLTKRYARNVAVKNISFEVGKGEIVGFLGKNGAGKTTTMRMLTCFLPPTRGEASVAGFDVLEQPLEVKKRIGYLPETPPLYPEMEVADLSDFRREAEGHSAVEIPKRVDEVCERTRLGRREGHHYRQALQRLPAARRHRPGDYSQSAGADSRRAHLRARSRTAARSPHLIASLSGDHTIILSTHILSEVEQSCSKVIIINDGEIVVSDSVANLHNRRARQPNRC